MENPHLLETMRQPVLQLPKLTNPAMEGLPVARHPVSTSWVSVLLAVKSAKAEDIKKDRLAARIAGLGKLAPPPWLICRTAF